MTRYTPQDQVHPPEPGTPPWDQVHTPRTKDTPPGPGTPPRDQGDTVYARAVHILLECILVHIFGGLHK